jgi:hypothetical protein
MADQGETESLCANSHRFGGCYLPHSKPCAPIYLITRGRGDARRRLRIDRPRRARVKTHTFAATGLCSERHIGRGHGGLKRVRRDQRLDEQHGKTAAGHALGLQCRLGRGWRSKKRVTRQKMQTCTEGRCVEVCGSVSVQHGAYPS